MSPPSPYALRAATPDDAREIIAVHRSAVLGVAARRYGDAIARSWAAPDTQAHEAVLRAVIASENERMVVATSDGSVVAFGSILIAEASLRALYVRAELNGKGIGTALLAALIAEAGRRGLTRLSMNASLNAAEFYAKRGFVKVADGFQELRDGARMPCVAMTKALT